MMKKLAIFVALVACTCAFSPSIANADVHPGCANDPWGFLGSKTRTICDGPKQPDGSWVRFRIVWIPAHDVPISTSCGEYSCTTSGGYFQDTQIFEKVKYPVTPETVVPGEPDWLPPTYTDAGGFTPVNFN